MGEKNSTPLSVLGRGFERAGKGIGSDGLRGIPQKQTSRIGSTLGNCERRQRVEAHLLATSLADGASVFTSGVAVNVDTVQTSCLIEEPAPLLFVFRYTELPESVRLE